MGALHCVVTEGMLLLFKQQFSVQPNCIYTIETLNSIKDLRGCLITLCLNLSGMRSDFRGVKSDLFCDILKVKGHFATGCDYCLSLNGVGDF